MSGESLPARAASLPRIPSLDGLRALSIVLVLALHTVQTVKASHPVSLVWYAIFGGTGGVFVFFVISGYLITSLLLNEQQKRGSISLSGFYLRRAMRILPPLYVYIAVLLLLGHFGRLAIDRLDILGSLFFFHNYVNGPMWAVEHVWSLSVEEQFYLLWPVILLLCLRRPGEKGRVLGARVALSVIVLAPIIRVLSFGQHSSWLHELAFHMPADALMFGCLLALTQGTPLFEQIYSAVTKRWWIPPIVIFLSNCIAARLQNYWQLPFGYTIAGAAIAFFMLWCVRNPASFVGRILNARSVVHIGVLSYSIYIWQTLFLHHKNAAVFGPSLRYLTVFPMNWLAALVVAELSFHLVEQPSLRLRNRILQSLHLYSIGRSQHPGAPISS